MDVPAYRAKLGRHGMNTDQLLQRIRLYRHIDPVQRDFLQRTGKGGSAGTGTYMGAYGPFSVH